MQDISIINKIAIDEVRLVDMSAKGKNNSEEENLDPRWEYSILKKDEEVLIVKASANAQNRRWFDLQATFVISFKILSEVNQKEIDDNIEDILYFATSKFTLLSSTISDMMYGFPLPIAPYADKKYISIKDNK